MTDNRIPSGLWQRVTSVLLFLFGIFAALAADPSNGAGEVATICFALAGPLILWGLLLKYLRVLEDRILDFGEDEGEGE